MHMSTCVHIFTYTCSFQKLPFRILGSPVFLSLFLSLSACIADTNGGMTSLLNNKMRTSFTFCTLPLLKLTTPWNMASASTFGGKRPAPEI